MALDDLFDADDQLDVGKLKGLRRGQLVDLHDQLHEDYDETHKAAGIDRNRPRADGVPTAEDEAHYAAARRLDAFRRWQRDNLPDLFGATGPVMPTIRTTSSVQGQEG